MFCSKCGAQIEDGTKFCPKCGQPAETATAPESATAPASEPVSAPAPAPAPAPAAAPAAAPKKPKNLGLIIAGALGAFLILFILMIVILVQPKKINLNKYVNVEFEGYQTVGTATIVFDEEAYTKDLKKALKIKDVKVKDGDDLMKALEKEAKSMAKLSTARGCVKAQLDKSSELSNGDTVELSFELDNKTAKELGLKFVGKSKKYKAEGFEEINVVDPFEYITVEFTGISPDGYMNFTYSGSIPGINQYNFSTDKNYSLKNGDQVLMTLNLDERYLIQQGYKVKEFSKIYTVEGLDGYVTSYSELTDDFKEYAKKEAEDIIASYCAQNYSTDYQQTPLQYAGYIFMERKPENYSGYYNGLYVIFKSALSHAENKFTTTEVYYPIYFYNILSTKDGMTSEKNTSVYGSSRLPSNSGYSTRGYINPIKLFSELTGGYKESHDIAGGDGFEKYSSYQEVTSLSDISESYLSTLSNEAVSVISQYCNSDYATSSHATNFSCVGYYFLNAKNPGSNIESNNRIYVVYSATLSNDENKFETTTVYYPVEFQGIVKLSDGSFSYMNQNSISGSVSLTNSWFNSYSTKGYTDGTKMYNELITSKRTDYNYSVSEGLAQFGN